MHPLPLIALLAAVGLSAGAAPPPAPLTTYDGKHDISTINLTVVYYVPRDRTPLPDWRARVDYFVKRIDAFHTRELDGRARLKITVHPDPLVTEKDAADLRRGDGDFTFFSTMDDVKTRLKWKPDRATGYPILLVLSDINWRELDDFRRERVVDGKPRFEGSLGPDGRHFPGAESGGARATYLRDPGYGMGLVSGDGWRVPYSGSDCVVYHEGIGHSIGLPHPTPIDDSVMGTGQYKFWINQSYMTGKQKRKLGWSPPPTTPDRSTDLFTVFTAIPAPPVPKPGEAVGLDLAWPTGAKVKTLVVRVQTELFGPWVTLPAAPAESRPRRALLGTFDRPTPVSYRVDAMLEDGQTAELWGYFQVKK